MRERENGEVGVQLFEGSDYFKYFSQMRAIILLRPGD